MRLLSLLLACALLLIGLAGLAIRWVPPGHVGVRGDAQLPPGPHWTTPMHRVRVEPAGPAVYGLRGAADAIKATSKQGGPTQVSAVLDGVTVDALKAAIAAGGPLPDGARIFSQTGTRRAEAQALQVWTDGLAAEVSALQAQATAVREQSASQAQATEQARAHAAAREEKARALRRAANAAAIDRVRAEARAEIDTISTRSRAAAAQLVADGTLALAQAEARRDQLRAQALAGPGGRYHLAIEAARAFTFDPTRLDPKHPEYFRSTWGLAAWRSYFLGGAQAPER